MAPGNPMNVPRYEFLARQGMEESPLYAYGDQTSAANYVVDGKWPSERKKIHREILSRLQEQFQDIPSGGKAVFIGGVPGGGKSTFRNSVTGLDSGYVISDPDMVREMLLEELSNRGMLPSTDARIEGGAKPAELSGLFHQEAQAINGDLEKWAIADRKNIIFDTSMGFEESLNAQLDSVYEQGYDTTGVYVQCDDNVALQRRMSRFEHESAINDGLGGRPVPPDFAENVFTNGPKVFEQARLRENGFHRSLLADSAGSESVFVNAWDGHDVSDAITGFHQLDFSSQAESVFVPEGIEGYLAPDPLPQFADIKTEPSLSIVDPNVVVEPMNAIDPVDFEKQQLAIPEGQEPGSGNYAIHADYGEPVSIDDSVVPDQPKFTPGDPLDLLAPDGDMPTSIPANSAPEEPVSISDEDLWQPTEEQVSEVAMPDVTHDIDNSFGSDIDVVDSDGFTPFPDVSDVGVDGSDDFVPLPDDSVVDGYDFSEVEVVDIPKDLISDPPSLQQGSVADFGETLTDYPDVVEVPEGLFAVSPDSQLENLSDGVESDVDYPDVVEFSDTSMQDADIEIEDSTDADIEIEADDFMIDAPDVSFDADVFSEPVIEFEPPPTQPGMGL